MARNKPPPNKMAKPGSEREGEMPASFRKPPTEFTEARKEKYLVLLRASGLKYMSAKGAGVSYLTVERHMKADAAFKDACTQALEERLDELEQAVFQRAIEGVEEPVIGGKDRDTVVTTIRRYSDGLATTLLKAKRPEFRDKLQADVNIKGGVLVLPGKPSTADDWEAEMGDKARGQTGKPA